MGDKNIFVNDMNTEASFDGIFSMYLASKEALAEKMAEKERLEKKLKEEKVEEGLSFEDKWKIYSIIKNLRNTRNYYYGIDLGDLRLHIGEEYPEVYELEQVYKSINELRSNIESLLDECVTFNCFVGEEFDDRCMHKHYLVRFHDELKCVCCGATTKDYGLSRDETNFLMQAAKHQQILIDQATKNDLPLIEVLLEEQDFSRSLDEPVDEDSENYSDVAEDQYLADLASVSEIERQVKKAHFIDNHSLGNDKLVVNDSHYLSDGTTIDLLDQIEEDLEKAKASTSRFRDLYIEDCYVAQYEILLLNGNNPQDLYNDIQNEEERIAFTRAYYNVSRSIFRTNSDYFNGDELKALQFDCVTANQEINNRILKMKVRR